MTLAEKFEALVKQGLIQPTLVAPHIEPFYEHRQTRMKTAYNVGEATIRGGARIHAQLEPSPQRDSGTGR